MQTEPDYYTTLNLSIDASADEIKSAYRQLARQLHPDLQDKQGTSLLFRQVQEAYDTLSDSVKRAAYDRRRIEAGLSPQAIFQWKLQPSRAALSVDVEEQVVYILFDIAAGQIEQVRERMPLNICLVLDRSTSMQGARLEQTKAAARRMIDTLTPDDALGVVAFSDKAEIVWPSQLLTDPVKAKAKVSSIQATGGTEILQGLKLGITELTKRSTSHAVNHLILLTDGQTYGDEDQCLRLAEEAKKHRLGISAMGIGEDWNDTLLDAIAARSGGVSQYIASTNEIQQFLRERLQGLSNVYADNLRILVKPTSKVALKSAFKLEPYIQRLEQFEEKVMLGALQADAPISGILELVVQAHSAGQHRLAQLELAGDISTAQPDDAVVRQELLFDFDPQANPNTPPPSHILSALAKITIFQMQEGALVALENGDVAGATHRLETMATRLLDMGEHQLARAALLEAGRLARSGNLSPAGRKAIKYGTRGLSFTASSRG
jgi:Ca-activated chloride channel family protein